MSQKLTFAVVLKHLRSRSFWVLGTADAAGRPHAARVEYAVSLSGLHVYVMTRRHLKNVAAHRNVAFVVHCGGFSGSFRPLVSNLIPRCPAPRPNEVVAVSKTSDPTIVTKVTSRPPALRGMTVRREDLAGSMRFAARIASRSAMPSLRCVRFGHEVIAATDLDVWLSAKLPGASRHRCARPRRRPQAVSARE
jgi:hypothetical protein